MADYKLDFEAFGVHVLNAEWMRAEMEARVVRMKAFAEAIAPFDPDSKDGTHYKDSFETTSRTHGGIHHDRAEGVLRNTDPAALIVEYGNENTPEHATLRKALDAAG